MSRHYETIKALDFEKRRNALIDETKEIAILGPDFAARLDNEYRRGKEDGQKIELQKFAIVYEPYQEVTEEYFEIKKRADIGYGMQLHYAGLPIGEQTRRAVQLLGSKRMSSKILPRKII